MSEDIERNRGDTMTRSKKELDKVDYSEFVDKLIKHPETFSPSYLDMLHAAVGLAGESGEILEILKKAIWQGHVLDYARLFKELGDVLFYFQALCNEIGTTPSNVRYGNIDKLLDRYPDGKFDPKRSLNRDVE